MKCSSSDAPSDLALSISQVSAHVAPLLSGIVLSPASVFDRRTVRYGSAPVTKTSPRRRCLISIGLRPEQCARAQQQNATIHAGCSCALIHNVFPCSGVSTFTGDLGGTFSSL